MRLDKYMAFCGCGSRSECKDLIKKGLVMVQGGQADDPRMQVGEAARVEVNGEILRYKKFLYIMLNKPAGYISATYDAHKPTVVDLLQGAYGKRELAPVGRLDEDTTGFMLLSDDGALAHFLLSPRRHVPKTYVARLARPPATDDVAAFEAGLDLGDFVTLPARLEPLGDNLARVTITQGKFHQVKRMFEKVGNEVLELKRVAFGPLPLDESLAEGAWRELTPQEEELLKNAVK